jgi:hypothetical protein
VSAEGWEAEEEERREAWSREAEMFDCGKVRSENGGDEVGEGVDEGVGEGWYSAFGRD